jgi:aminopeptidase N
MIKFCFIVFVSAIIYGCSTSKKNVKTPVTINSASSDTIEKLELLDTHQSATRKIDILHTKLEVSFDWENLLLYGNALIQLKPYFYPIKEITLDARDQEIKSVTLLTSTKKPLVFTNNKTHLTIELDKEYRSVDTLVIIIDYVAKGVERETSDNIENPILDKGLYFVNPFGKDKDKPTQIWTQGEPEANSCWFPTIDKPNERMTQEVYITLDSALLETISPLCPLSCNDGHRKFCHCT